MPSTEILIAFLAATAVFAYMPGPSTLYAAAQTIAGGRRAGWMAVLGIHLGGYVHVMAAAFGLAILFSVVPVLYVVLKFVGAAYLVWLGMKLVFSRSADWESADDVAVRSPRRAFFDSMIVEIFNPKTALFYLAFLPQFTQAGAALPIWAQLLVLGTLVNVLFSSADVLCVILADKVVNWFRGSPSANKIAGRIGGGLLIALGINMAFQKH